FGSGRSIIEITIHIIYPARCGISMSCKKKLADAIQARINAYISSILLQFKFDDGSFGELALTRCKKFIDSSLNHLLRPRRGAKVTTTTTTTTTKSSTTTITTTKSATTTTTTKSATTTTTTTKSSTTTTTTTKSATTTTTTKRATTTTTTTKSATTTTTTTKSATTATTTTKSATTTTTTTKSPATTTIAKNGAIAQGKQCYVSQVFVCLDTNSFAIHF
ncbi:unnamed protein product, partial [Rotaria sp. Silwood2]